MVAKYEAGEFSDEVEAADLLHEYEARIAESARQALRRRRTAHTDLPVFPNLALGVVPGGRDKLWVADITYIAVATGFVYVALVVDA